MNDTGALHSVVYIEGPAIRQQMVAIFPTRNQAEDWVAEKVMFDGVRETHRYFILEELLHVAGKPYKPAAVSANDLRVLEQLHSEVQRRGLEYLGSYQGAAPGEGDSFLLRADLLNLQRFLNEFVARVVK